MRNLSLVSLLAAVALFPACTDSTATDELDGESAADGEDGKADAAAVFTYFNVRPDSRACSLNSGPDCGRGFFVSRANRTTTQCGRGAAQSQCKVFDIDWTGTAMPASVAKSYEDALRSGTPLLVRGSIAPGANDAAGKLAVTEIWVASTPEWVDGVFTMVHDNGIRCVRAPCPSLTERKLNSNLSANLTGVDFEESSADEAAIERARDALYGPGLIVVGYRSTDSLGGKTRGAGKFFTRAPVPLH